MADIFCHKTENFIRYLYTALSIRSMIETISIESRRASKMILLRPGSSFRLSIKFLLFL